MSKAEREGGLERESTPPAHTVGQRGGCDEVTFSWGPRVPPGTLDPVGSGALLVHLGLARVRARRPPGARRPPRARRVQHQVRDMPHVSSTIRGHVAPGAMASAQRESSTRRRLDHIPLTAPTFCAACPRSPPLGLLDVRRRDAQAAPSRFRPSWPRPLPERRSETRNRKRAPGPF